MMRGSTSPKSKMALLLLLQLHMLLSSLHLSTGAAEESVRKPNIILLLVDDVDHFLGSDSPERMPQMSQHIAQQGINFTNYFVNFALCCPSRTSILTGRCSHNTGVISNTDSGLLSGEERFIQQGHEHRTLPVWLKEAGYHTALIGKYLNGYGSTKGVSATHVPPGWDEWLAFINIDYFNWTASDNGKLVSYGLEEDDYSTDVLKRRALRYLRTRAAAAKPAPAAGAGAGGGAGAGASSSFSSTTSGDGERAGTPPPFFLYLTPYAAHAPEVPAPRHDGKLDGIKIPRTPNWPGEYAQMRDKRSAMKLYPRIQRKYLDLFDFVYQKRAETLLAVDEMIDEIVTELEATGQLDNTYIFFTSDNGYHLGHHRMMAGKTAPYEENIHLFLYVRGPSVPQGIKMRHMLGNIDLAPTIAELAGATPVTPPEAPIDGISFAPLLRDASARQLDPDGLRAGFLIEKIFGLEDAEHVAAQIVTNDRYHDPFAGHRRPALSFWEEAALPPPAPLQPNDTVKAGDEAYDNNLVNRGAELTDDGIALKNGAMGPQGSPAGTQFAPFYEKHGYNVTDYFNGVGFNFPSSYYGLRISNRVLGEILFLECGFYGHEMYNMTSDPYQMLNVYAEADPTLVGYLQNLLDKLKYCKGSASCSPTARSIPPFLFDVSVSKAVKAKDEHQYIAPIYGS